MPLDQLKIAIIGLGYVGLLLAVEFGKQRPVLGFDINERRIGELQAARDSTLEITAEELRGALHHRSGGFGCGKLLHRDCADAH